MPPLRLTWTANPQASDESYAYLAQVVEAARGDDGLTLPTIGLAGLAETGRMLENGLEDMTAIGAARGGDRRHGCRQSDVAGRVATRSGQHPGPNGAARGTPDQRPPRRAAATDV